jgi:hypothetical protein
MATPRKVDYAIRIPFEMLTSILYTLGLAVTALCQAAPEGYRTVYITSAVNTQFVVVPKAPVQNGTTLVVYVLPTSKIYS